jgi:ABC-type long-subunit fatty acid transport system fused permease/ATPase subunit
VDAAGPIEQRELGVVMQVDEGFRGVRHSFGWLIASWALLTHGGWSVSPLFVEAVKK